MQPEPERSWQGTLLDLGQHVVGTPTLQVPCCNTVCISVQCLPGHTCSHMTRRTTIWPCGPGERKEGLAAHQYSPSGRFSNCGVRIPILGSQEEVQTKRKMTVFYCWFQELLKVLICLFECSPAVEYAFMCLPLERRGPRPFISILKGFLIQEDLRKCSVIKRFNCVWIFAFPPGGANLL